MFKKIHFIYSLVVWALMTSCLGENPFEEQRKKDEQTIRNYVAQTSLLGTTTTSGLFYTITNTNTTGTLVGTNGIAEVSYKLFNLDKIKIAESGSYIFKPSVGSFAAGLSEGVSLMRKGEKATLVLPSALAFGTGRVTVGNIVIPPNSVVVIEVEVLEVRTDQQQTEYERSIIRNYFATRLTPPVTTFTKDTADVYVINQAPATAVTSLTPNLNYSVDYTLRKATDNTLLDQGTLPYIHSTNSVIRGFYIGMLSMRVGGQGYIGVPSSMGYGATGSSSKIAPYTPLIFEITRIRQ
jgi:FKBP-type peptidyl-prolyl cis-trans isomerase